MKGFTLVEILVTVLILSFFIGGLFMVLNMGGMTYSTDLCLLDLQQQARLAMHGMIRELRQTNEESGRGNLNIVSATEITFSIPSGTYSDPWIGPIRYYLNNLENQIIREYPAGTEKPIANDIDNLVFSLTGNLLEIQLSCAKTARRRELSFSLREQVRLRNE